MKLAYFDCFSGVSGDMCLGALVAAGYPADRLADLPRRLKLEGVSIEIGTARRGPFAATRVEVQVEGKPAHRHLKHMLAIIEQGDLTPRVRDRALEVFRRLAAAEAEVHGQTIEKVHFHEVGGADAIVDIVGTVEALESLGVERCYCSTLRLGRGSVMSEHGVIPVPAPATTLLLRGAPVEIPAVDVELVTPTGAALMAALVADWGPPPAFRLEVAGTGAGGRDLKEQANVLRVLIGEVRSNASGRRRVSVLETALDDENPQVLADLGNRLLSAGALDVMTVPALMKKGRQGTWLVVLSELEHADALATMLLSETSTLGVRVREEERIELERSATSVETAYGTIAMKVAVLPDGAHRAAPEFESVRAASERAGVPVREVRDAALAAWRSQRGAETH